jgi:threonyl-tRNA synthetase
MIQLTLDVPHRAVASSDYPALEKLMDIAVKDKQKFERLLVSKDNLLKMFEVGVHCYPSERTLYFSV